MPDQTETIDSLAAQAFTETAPQVDATVPQETSNAAPQEGRQGEQQEAAPLPLDAQLKEYFPEFTGENPAEFFQNLQQERHQRAELERQVEFMRMQALVNQQQPARQPEPQQHVDPLADFVPPAYDPSWDRYIEGKNEDGTLKWKADAPMEVRAKADAREAFRANFADKLLANPRQNLIDPVLAEADRRAEAIAERKFAELVERQQSQAVIERALDENASWIYAKDRNGKTVMGPDGQPVWTEAGKRWEAFYMDAKNSGVTNDAKALEYATYLYQAQYGDPKRAEVKQTIAQNRVAAQLSPANHIPQRNGQQLPVEKAPSLTEDDPDAWVHRFMANLGIAN